MTDSLAATLLDAAEDGFEVRFVRRPSDTITAATGLEILVEDGRDPDARLVSRQILTREETLSPIGNEAIAYAIRQARYAIRNAPPPRSTP